MLRASGERMRLPACGCQCVFDRPVFAGCARRKSSGNFVDFPWLVGPYACRSLCVSVPMRVGVCAAGSWAPPSAISCSSTQSTREVSVSVCLMVSAYSARDNRVCAAVFVRWCVSRVLLPCSQRGLVCALHRCDNNWSDVQLYGKVKHTSTAE